MNKMSMLDRVILSIMIFFLFLLVGFLGVKIQFYKELPENNKKGCFMQCKGIKIPIDNIRFDLSKDGDKR